MNEFVADHKKPLLAFVIFVKENNKQLKGLLNAGFLGTEKAEEKKKST